MTPIVVKIKCFSLLLLIFATCGCTTNLPIYTWKDTGTALEIMAGRADQIHSMMGQGQIKLTRKDGMSVVLDTAIAAKPPHAMHMRAWKFDRTVLDVTAVDGGLWLWSSQEKSDEQSPAQTAKAIADGVLIYLLPGRDFFTDPSWQLVDEQPSHLELEKPAKTGVPAMRMNITRDTLVIKHIAILGDDHSEIGSILYDDFCLSGTIPWPSRIRLRSAQGQVDLHVSEIEFNTELQKNVFAPPQRAVKLQ